MEPSNAELLTHLEYIKGTVDEIKTDMKDVKATSVDHEVRLVKQEERTAKWGKWSTIGGFFGGIVSGFLGGKIGG